MKEKYKKVPTILKSIVFLKIKSMGASSGPPIGPILGQCGIPSGPFCKDFNERTKIFNQNIIVFVTIKLLITNEYIFDISLPNMSFFFKRAIGLNYGIRNPGYIYNSNQELRKLKLFKRYKYITPYMYYEVIFYKYQKVSVEINKSILKRNIGTLKSIGVFLLTS